MHKTHWKPMRPACIRGEARSIDRWSQNVVGVGVADLSGLILPFPPHSLSCEEDIISMQDFTVEQQGTQRDREIQKLFWWHCCTEISGREGEKPWCFTALKQKPEQEKAEVCQSMRSTWYLFFHKRSHCAQLQTW